MSQGRVSLTIAGNPSESGCSLPRAGKSGDVAAAPRHRSAPASLTPRASLPGVWLSCPELQDGCCAPGRHSHVSFRRKEEARRREAHTSPTLISLASTPSLGHGQGHVGTRRQTETPGEFPILPGRVRAFRRLHVLPRTWDAQSFSFRTFYMDVWQLPVVILI